MYESLTESDPDLARFLREPDPALVHGGDRHRLLKMHRQHVALALNSGEPAPERTWPLLMRRLADARTMRCAADDLLARGGKAPGPNGHRLEDLSDRCLWQMCRGLADAIRYDAYRPGPGRTVRLPKPDKPGQHRELSLLDVEDRVVGRAMVLILQPLLDPAFSPFSFGFRPKRGCQQALATALTYARRRGAWWWASADIAQAFDRVPLSRLLGACRRRLPEDVCAFIERIASTGKPRGVRQGAPHSPLLFNVLADQSIDQPWHRRHPDLPLFRYADDLLLITRTPDEAMAAAADLTKLAMGAGTPLKVPAERCIVDLRMNPVDWLGYRPRAIDGEMAIGIAPAAWSRLALALAKAHLLPDAPLRAVQAVRGWLGYLGPCYAHADRQGTLDRLQRMAAVLAFEGLPSAGELQRVWAAAHARWAKIQAEQERLLEDRLRRIRSRRGSAAPAAPDPMPEGIDTAAGDAGDAPAPRMVESTEYDKEVV